MPSSQRSFWGFAFLAALLFTAAPTQAQNEVTITIDAENLGLDGIVRPGAWTPVRVTLKSNLPKPTAVICQWTLDDVQGDRVVVERELTLNPDRSQHRWLYAQPHVNISSPRWNFHALDANTGKLLGTHRVQVRAERIKNTQVAVIGIFGHRPGGLQAYASEHTQHEPIHFLNLERTRNLPDRWYGYSMMQALIWTRGDQSNDPDDLDRETNDAIREWVRRGGHLVIALPTVGQLWTKSTMSDLLPPVDLIRHTDQEMPWFLSLLPGKIDKIDYLELRPRAGSKQKVTTLLRAKRGPDPVYPKDTAEATAANTTFGPREEHGPAIVAAHRYGYGMVTLVGIDLNDRRLLNAQLPNGPYLWGNIFGWRSPAFTAAFIKNRMQADDGGLPIDLGREKEELGGFIDGGIRMTKQVAGRLMAAIFLFSLYWLVAGPIGFAMLRQRKILHHSWLAFTGVVLVFTVLAWGGAFMLRPIKTNIMHFSVVDFDSQSQDVHIHSWFTLYVPKHGEVEVKVDPEDAAAGIHVLASAGLMEGSDRGEFLDPQNYSMHAGSPSHLRIPFRSTSKQLEADYLGPLTDDNWIKPTPGSLPLRTKVVISGLPPFPTGGISHGLPGTLRHVLMVYCPGNNKPPWVYRPAKSSWPPQQSMTLDPPGLPKPLHLTASLDTMSKITHFHTRSPTPGGKPIGRRWENEGYLGRLIQTRGTKLDPRYGTQPPTATRSGYPMKNVEMLSFYSALPPPDFTNKDWVQMSVGGFAAQQRQVRGLGRAIDITAWTSLKQLIVIGLLDKTPLPLPLSVDGRTVSSKGCSVVRWTCPVE